jgi:tetratricopeptide (TPR) repeat protein
VVRASRIPGNTGVCACLCVLSCATYGARPKSPAEGGATWTRVESDHFTVVSDLPREEAESTARELEQGLEALTNVVFKRPRTPVEHTTVVVFQDSSDFHAFMPSMVEGRFYPHLSNDPEGPRFLVVHGNLMTDDRIAFFHELTHDLFDRNFGSSPPWLREGWAEYYSSIRTDGHEVIFGERARHLTFTEESGYFAYREKSGAAGLAIPIGLVPPPSKLIHMRQREFYGPALASNPTTDDELSTETNYAAAWALVHMLLDGPAAYQELFKAFLQGAVAGKTLDAAFRTAFADVSPAQLDQDFRRYLAAREIVVSKVRYVPPAKPFSVTSCSMTDAEVHLYWAFLTAWRGPSAQAARRDLDAAVAAAPTWPDATYYRGLFFLAAGDTASAVRDIGLALEASPGDSRFLLGALVLSLRRQNATHSGDTAPLLDAAERLRPVAHTAVELNVAADTLRRLSRLDEALELAERAVALAPVDADILDTLANVLFDLGRVEEAVQIQTTAASFLDEDTGDHGITKRLVRYKAALDEREKARGGS